MSLTGVDRLLAERDIRDCLTRYCRGIDRMDRELLESVYWPDAYDDHDVWKGPAREFIPWVLEALGNFDQTIHMLGQTLIEFSSPDQAKVETYLYNYLRQKAGPDSAKDVLNCGRYLDVVERRGGQWRIAHRRLIVDWIRDFGVSPRWGEPIVDGVWKMGGRKPDDLSYILNAFAPLPS